MKILKKLESSLFLHYYRFKVKKQFSIIWTGVIAHMVFLFATITSEQVLELGKLAEITETNKRI